MTDATSKAISKVTQDLFELAGFPKLEPKVEKTEVGFSINLTVDPEQSGAMIGYHGETIASLQLILSLLTYHSTGEWHRLTLNINDYRDKRQDALVEMAKSAASRAKTSGQEIALPPMSSFDRRVIHMALSEDSDVTTQSVGVGRDRRLVIYPKTTTA